MPLEEAGANKGRSPSQSLAFTAYVKSLDGGQQPAESIEEAVWRKLADALRHELRQRGLWLASPSYLGIVGSGTWNRGDAFEELLCDCYSFVFVHRLAGLAGLLAFQENIEGVVFRNIRLFLFERQRRHDPVGYRVFVVARKAVRTAVREMWLFVLRGDQAVTNETVLGFDPTSTWSEEDTFDFGPTTYGWSAELLPGLVTARATRLERLVIDLAERMHQLGEPGLVWFRFRDLVEPFKGHVRQLWSEMWWTGQGEVAFEVGIGGDPEPVFLTWPEMGFEQHEDFSRLTACVEEGLASSPGRRKTREYLERLWIFLRAYSASGGPLEPQPGGPTAVLQESKLPSRRQLAERLEIPRYRLPQLFESLGQLVQGCSAAARPRSPEEGNHGC